MPDLEKIIGWALRMVTTVLVGGTGYQLFDGRWFGETIFNTYLQRHAVIVLTRPSNDELYGIFAAQSVPLAMENSSGALIFFSLVLLLALFAHVISKPTVAKLRAALQPEQVPRRVPRTRGEWKSVIRFAWCMYVKFHEFGTLCLFLALICLFFFWPFSRGLAIAFLLITIPSALYLLIYSSDISRGEFSERFAYACAFVMLVVAVIGWPRLYGQRYFDPDFALASSSGSPDHCDENQLFKGPTFVAFEKGDELLLFRLCFSKTGEKKYVDFFSTKGQQVNKLGSGKLSFVLKTFVPPVAAP